MTALLELVCDVDGCPAQFTDVGACDWMTRLRAAERGWDCDAYGDYCPEHNHREADEP